MMVEVGDVQQTVIVASRLLVLLLATHEQMLELTIDILANCVGSQRLLAKTLLLLLLMLLLLLLIRLLLNFIDKPLLLQKQLLLMVVLLMLLP